MFIFHQVVRFPFFLQSRPTRSSNCPRMLIGNDVQADSVHANLGFFGDRLLVGGTEAEPNVYISSSGEISASYFRSRPIWCCYCIKDVDW